MEAHVEGDPRIVLTLTYREAAQIVAGDTSGLVKAIGIAMQTLNGPAQVVAQAEPVERMEPTPAARSRDDLLKALGSAPAPRSGRRTNRTPIAEEDFGASAPDIEV